MRIVCDFCRVEVDVRDTADAISRGWYTHTVQTTYLTYDPEPFTAREPRVFIAGDEIPCADAKVEISGGSKTEPVSMGFVCGPCGSLVPEKEA